MQVATDTRLTDTEDMAVPVKAKRVAEDMGTIVITTAHTSMAMAMGTPLATTGLGVGGHLGSITSHG